MWDSCHKMALWVVFLAVASLSLCTAADLVQQKDKTASSNWNSVYKRKLFHFSFIKPYNFSKMTILSYTLYYKVVRLFV